MWEAFERHEAVGQVLAAEAWSRDFTSPIGNYLWFVAELSEYTRNNPMHSQLLSEWHATYAGGQEGYVGNMRTVYATLRKYDVARFQCDEDEVHEELIGSSLALHRRWRVTGYPPDHLEKVLRAVCNVLRIPFDLATDGITEVLSTRDSLAS